MTDPLLNNPLVKHALAAARRKPRFARFAVELRYGSARRLSCEVERHSDDSLGAVLTALTAGRLPAEFINDKPVYWNFDKHGRWARITKDKIFYGVAGRVGMRAGTVGYTVRRLSEKGARHG